MDESKSSLKFWTVLTVFILAVAIVVTLIDLTIKTAILEESNRLQRFIWDAEGHLNGQGQEGSNSGGIAVDLPISGYFPGDILDSNPARMEAGNVSNRTPQKNNRTPGTARKTRQMGKGNSDIPAAD